jgi:hypothetical protein
MRRNHLFSRHSIFDVVENQKHLVQTGVQNLDSNYILNASEADLVASLVEEFRLNVPSIKEDEICVAEHEETQIDVSGDPMRLIMDRSRPFYMPGTKTVISVPFDGDAGFFGVRPSTFSLSPPIGDVVGNELHLTYQRLDHDAEAMKRDYTATVAQVKQHLQSLRESANVFNGGLEGTVRQLVTTRKAKLLADAGMVASLGLPLKKRTGVPTTYAVPVQRRRPKIERPQATTAPFTPEPALPNEEYDSILGIMRNMVAVMEQSPKAFEEMGEEDLRTQFLVQLNGQYEGGATGETFNFQGKTDILIRADGKNVFVAECKFWKGEKQLLATIDQLLSYLSWRDTKVAILVFNRQKDFGAVLSKIGAAVPSHPCFKRDLGKADESTFRYVFRQPSDANREILLTVMAFDVPTKAV